MIKSIKKYSRFWKTLRPLIFSLCLLGGVLFLQKALREQGPRNFQGLFDTLSGTEVKKK
jgi:hypothetical protein